MRKINEQGRGVFFSGVVLLLTLITFPVSTNAQQHVSNKLKGTRSNISEEKFVLINGIEQWVTIKGDPSKPAVLFLHGGPGSPLSPYADHLYKSWQTDFIIVQWDQRGAGRTYGKMAPDELSPEYLKNNPLTLDQMTDDGIALTEYLIKHLGKTKVILFGTSWGSVLGIKMVTEKPELFYAYVGHSQVVNPAIDQTFYNHLYKTAESKKDSSALVVLKTIGEPPYERARTVGQLLRVVKKYESENSIPAPQSWFEPSADYNSKKDELHRNDGDDYSFVNYIGDKVLGVPSMSAAINFERDHLAFKIPVYIIQGEEDILTPKEKTKVYFEKISAPEKKYYLVPKAAHGFNEAILEMQFKVLKSVKTNR